MNLPKYVSFVGANRSIEDAKSIFEQRIDDALDVYEKYSGEFIDRPCPVCGNFTRAEVDKFHKTYGIVKCCTCGTVYVDPCPNLGALEYYYNDCACNEMLGAVYRKRVMTKNPILSSRTISVLGIVKKILSEKDDGDSIRILEVGCNSGGFLSELKTGLKELGVLDRCELVGVDIDKNAVEDSVDPELALYGTAVEKYSENNSLSFDLIIHFELIEHLADPAQFMRQVALLLKSNGVHYFHTPNALGMDNMALSWNAVRPLAHGIFPPMHLNAFTTQNIVAFALFTGFNVSQIETTGMLDVDMVKIMVNEIDENSPFSYITEFSDEQLAIVQQWLKVLNASSHMCVTLIKQD